MFSPARKTIVLTVLSIAVIFTGFTLMHKSSESTTNKTITVQSTTTQPLFAVERELAVNAPKQFEDPRVTMLVADSDYLRIDVTPAEYLGLTENEKAAVLQTYRNVADTARSQVDYN